MDKKPGKSEAARNTEELKKRIGDLLDEHFGAGFGEERMVDEPEDEPEAEDNAKEEAAEGDSTDAKFKEMIKRMRREY